MIMLCLTKIYTRYVIPKDSSLFILMLHQLNVMVDGPSGHVCLTDFSLPGFFTPLMDLDVHNLPPAVRYMAPEAFNEKSYTIAGDIYSFGRIYWMVGSPSTTSAAS